MSDLSILTGLNPQQEEAVTTTEGPLLILAGAGSGKTNVLTKRIAWILSEEKARRSQIMAVTFTNKAAKEMIERIEGICGAGHFTNVGTFHSVCSRWLRREAKYLDVSSSFSIYDTASQISLMKGILKDQNVDAAKLRPRDLLSQISAFKNKRQGPGDISPLLVQNRTLIPIYKEYNARLRANDSLDFDDLLVETVNMFEKHPEVCEKYRSYLHYILVDEFQDVNPLQYELLQMIIGPEQNFCAVGDDDQSIYGFRGADISIILRFENDFSNAKVIKLEQNYRSTQQILDVANAVVGNNVSRKDKRLWSNRRDGGVPFVYVAEDEKAEARFVVALCRMLVERSSYRYSDIAILYRTNVQSRNFEEVLLREEGIGYEIVGGRRFYDRKEIKDVIAYFSVLANPSDSVALERIISNTPGIGSGTFNKIIAFAAHDQLPVMHALAMADKAGVAARTAKLCRGLYDWLAELSRTASNPACSLTSLMGMVLEHTQYKQHLEESGADEDYERVENLNELINVLREFDSRFRKHRSEEMTGTLPLIAFMNEVSLISCSDEFDDDNAGSDKLILMTIHTSKGLEFPVVFLVGMEEGLLPHRRSVIEGEKGIAEERRLCYVGLTRAKDQLYITAAAKRRNVFDSEHTYSENTDLSRFLYEMPQDAVSMKCSEGDALSFRMLAQIRSGKGFHAAEEELREEHGSEAAQVMEERHRGQSSNNIRTAVMPRPLRRSELAKRFPPGCTVRHKIYGKGVVSFLANHKLWVRFEARPNESLPCLCEEVEKIED